MTQRTGSTTGNVAELNFNDVLVDLSSYLGRLRVNGSDAIDLLDRLSTNRLTDLTAPGMGMRSVLTTNKGRVIDLLGIHMMGNGILVVTSGAALRKVADWIEFYTIMEDVENVDISGNTFHLRLIGIDAYKRFPEVNNITNSSFLEIEISGSSCTAIRTKVGGDLCLDIIGRKDDEGSVRQILLSDMDERSLLDYERYRISKGEPAFGSELTEDFNPLEAGLIDYIHFNKGCYIGQEVVARLNTYDKVQRKLVKLTWQGSLCGRNLYSGDQSAGIVTSMANGFGLGFVKKIHAEPGTVLACGEESVTIVELSSD